MNIKSDRKIGTNVFYMETVVLKTDEVDKVSFFSVTTLFNFL